MLKLLNGRWFDEGGFYFPEEMKAGQHVFVQFSDVSVLGVFQDVGINDSKVFPDVANVFELEAKRFVGAVHDRMFSRARQNHTSAVSLVKRIVPGFDPTLGVSYQNL